jgi:diacylglycerol O-acyltransferase / trehalose O-mycolyltransferase
MNVALHERLLELGIDHTWFEGPGTHTWPYWRRDLRLELPAIIAALADPRTVGSRWR